MARWKSVDEVVVFIEQVLRLPKGDPAIEAELSGIREELTRLQTSNVLFQTARSPESPCRNPCENRSEVC